MISRGPDPEPRAPESRVPVFTLALVYLVAHLAFLSPSLEDIDSINFALGLRDFDVAKHQPHPPGYPVYIALGRAALFLVDAVAPSMDRVRAEALALSVWSAIGGAIAILAAYLLFVALDRLRASPEVDGARVERSINTAPFWATVLLAASPLFWMTGLRPMSDMTGLAAALVAQVLALRGCVNRRSLVAAALVIGCAAGIRTQTVWLTLPLFIMALVAQRGAGVLWLASRPIAALVAGALAWFVPLLVASGGLDAFLQALASQAGEDLAWVDMLWANPTPRHIAYALFETFVLPWHSIPLAVAILLLAAIGAVVVLLRERTALGVLSAAFVPYLVYHLLLQETVMTRYALPVVPPLVWLAIRGTRTAGRVAPVLATALVVFALVTAVPGTIAYGREAAPAFRAIAAMQAELQHPPGSVYAHFALRRPLQAAAGALPVVEPRRSFEWLGLVDYWRSGRSQPVWFLADPRRTDLALIDPQSRRHVEAFRWRAAGRGELSGTRPAAVDWYRFDPPGWFAAEGWALTAETGGIAQATRQGIDRRPIDAFVRRRSGPMHLVVGGRHLGPSTDPATNFRLSIDDMPVSTWTLSPADGPNFLRFIDLPDGLPAGASGYARLTIAAAAESGPTPAVAIRQFDIQAADTLIYGFADGWHEDEYDNATGLHWRWTSRRSVLRVSPAQGVELTIRGESPLRYFGDPPTVRITAAGRTIAELRPSRDFEWRVVVPAGDVASAQGAIAIETDRVYLPGQAEGTSDVRQLGLRLFDVRVNPVAH